MHPSVTYSIPGNVIDRPVDFDSLDPDQQALFTHELPDEYFQRLSKSFHENDILYRKYEDLNNEMQYNWNHWQFYNEMRYSFKYGKVRESSSRVTKYEDMYDFMLTHTYKQLLPDDDPTFYPANDISFDFNYKVDAHYAVSGGVTYNLDESTRNQWRLGGRYTQDCWSVDVSLRKDITPRPTGYTQQAGLFVQLEFIPFASMGSKPIR